MSLARLVSESRLIADELIELRRSIHSRPEVGIRLPETQAAVLAALEGLPVELTPGVRSSSVSGVLRGGHAGGTVLLRAEMDALPVAERSGEPYSAPASSGRMHACGHDLHVASLVGAIRLLSARAVELHGDVLFTFEAGEEADGGAELLLQDGLLELAPSPILAAYALHATAASVPRGRFLSCPGTILAAADTFEIEITGRSGHGSSPHLAADPVAPLAQIVAGLHGVSRRCAAPFDPIVVSVGQLEAGDAPNIIPGSARARGTLRTFSTTARERSRVAVELHCDGIAAAAGVKATVTWRQGYPPTVNDAASVDAAAAVVRALLGDARWAHLDEPMTGAEDFAYILARVPGAFIVFGATPDDLDPAAAAFNHAAEARFDDSLIPDAAAVLAGIVLRHLDTEAEE